MKIVLIELNFHYDSLDSLCRLFSNEENDLLVFTTKNIYYKLSPIKESKNIKFYIQRSSRLQLIKNHLNEINSADFIFINTISRDFRLFGKIDFAPSTIARIHNIHKTFSPFKHIVFPITPLRVFKSISYGFRDVLLGGFFLYRKKALKHIDFISFPDKNMEVYALKQGYVNPDNIAPILPIKFFTEILVTSEQLTPKAFNIAVIGSIDARRKDYDGLLRVLQKFNNDDHIPINLYFLGDSSNHSGKKLKEKTLSITNQKLNVIFFEGYVELQAFKNVLSCSDVIISPLKENAIVEIYLESYGKSKTSGTLSDMITFGIPTIIQNKNENIDEVYNLVDSYKNDDELADLLELYIANPNLLVNKRKHLLKYVEREYSKKVIYQRFINFVDSKK